MRALGLLVVLSSLSALADPQVPPPRGHWAKDETGKVSASTLAALDAIGTSLDDSGAAQLGVLVTTTTSGANPRDFATGIFNSWGVGHASTNDGVLIFIAVNDRKAEIILGTGSRISTSQTDEVMRSDIVANMKAGNLDQALLSAARALDGHARRAVGAPAAPHPGDNTGLGPHTYVTPVENYVPPSDQRLVPYVQGSASFPERSPRSWVVDLTDALTPSQRAQLDVAASDIYTAGTGRIFFLVYDSAESYPDAETLAFRLMSQVRPLATAPPAVIALNVGSSDGFIKLDPESLSLWELQKLAEAQSALRATALVDRVAALVAAQRFAQQALERKIPPRPMGDVLNAAWEANQRVVQAGGVGLLVLAIVAARVWNRRRVRSCEHCHQPRVRLLEEQEDPHLSAAQQKEESIGSVDYDVWWCERCRDPLVLRYGTIFTMYSGCDKCGAKTLRSTTTTIERATEWSGGRERVDRNCVHCGYSHSFTRSTPRITRSSSSSSSSSSSRSSSSFGGGSSSGRGSSGSW